MADMTVELARFTLQQINMLEKQLSSEKEAEKEYKLQLRNVGMNSSLGQIFKGELQMLKGNISQLEYRIDSLKQSISGFDMSLLNDEESSATTDVKEENLEEVEYVEEIIEEEIKTEVVEEENNVKESIEQKNNDSKNEKLECDYYKICCVAAYKNGNMLDALIIEDEKDVDSQILQLYREYGNNIEVKYNYNGYSNNQKEPIYEYMGWKDVKELYKPKKPTTTSSVKETAKEEKTKVEQVNNTAKEQTEEAKEYSQFIDMYGLEEDKGIHGLKIVYSNGSYWASYDVIKDGEIIHNSDNYPINTKYIYDKFRKKRRAKKYNLDQKSDIYKYMDFNLLWCLEDIDSKNNTHYASDYMRGILNIRLKYDLKSMLHDKKLKIEDKLRLRKIAIKQRGIANADIEGRYPKSAIVGAVASFVFLATLGISNILPSFGKKDSNSTAKNKNAIEKQTNVDTTKDISTEEVLSDIVNSKGKVGSGIESIMKDVATTTATTDKKETKEKTGTGINDSFRLVEKDEEGNVLSTFILSKGLNENSKKVLVSDYKDCDKFKISAIAICKDGKQLDIINSTDADSDIRTTELDDKYGKDIDIYFNFDAYKDGKTTAEYKRIGWLNSKDFNKDGKVSDIAAAQEEIKKHNESINIKETEAEDTKEEVTENENTQKEENKKESTKTETASNDDENIGPGYYDFGLEGKIMLAFRDKYGEVVFSQKLANNAWGDGELIDAGKIDCDYFKISRIAVYSGSNLLASQPIEEGQSVDDLTNYMYQQFGADIEIAYNFDGVKEKEPKDEHYKYVGWLNLDKLVSITDAEKEAAANYNKAPAKVKSK